MNRLFKIIFLMLILAAGTLSIVLLWQSALAPTGADQKYIEIARGTDGERIAHLLYEADLISYPLVFRLRLRMSGRQTSIKAGEYRLDGSMGMDEIIEVLVKGVPAPGIKVTIPEGVRFSIIARMLEEKSVIENSSDFVELCFNPSLLKGKLPDLISSTLANNEPIESGAVYSLEGYLFPDTYYFHSLMAPEDVIVLLLRNFERRLPEDWREWCQDHNMNLHELLTLASIVENEAILDRERPVIAGVFLNRIRKNMKLESCATVQYALGTPKPRLLYEDLKIDSPYNTYLVEGLPRGPIGSPGLKSIKAVMEAQEHKYLYFVAKKDGSHEFSGTNREHERAKRRIKRTGQ